MVPARLSCPVVVGNVSEVPHAAKAEFFLAAAGPAMSLLIGVIGLSITGLIDLYNAPSLDVVIVVASYIGTINLYLAGFNMIPGFPLDGGRVLRSILWAARGDRAKATPIAARGGQLVARPS